MDACEICEFKTNRKSNLQRHLASQKHKDLTYLKRDVENKESTVPCPARQSSPGTSGNLILNEQLQQDHLEDELENFQDHEENVYHNNVNAVIGDSLFDDEVLDNSHGYNDDENKATEPEDTSWFPFRSKTDMLLYVLMNSPTHSVSEEVMKFVLFMMKECGIDDVPSLQSLKEMQFGKLRWDSLIARGEDSNGNPFWVMKPSELVSLSVAHPDISKDIVRNPTKTSDLSHPADAEKWKKIDFIARCNSKTFGHGGIYYCSHIGMDCMVKVLHFQDNLQTDVLEAKVNVIVPGCNRQFADSNLPDRCLVICDRPFDVPLQSLLYIDVELEDANPVFCIRNDDIVQLSEEEHEQFVRSYNYSPEPTVTVPINLFLDDTSTHKSKRWLPLHCIQMQLSGLPVALRQKQKFVQFLAASEKVDIMALGNLIVEDIKMMSEGIPAFDAKNKEECRVRSCLDVIVADFNMLSYCCNHLGASAKKFCPRCTASRSTYSLNSVMRTPEQTQRTSQRINMRCNEKDKKRLRTLTGVKEHYNCFWDVLDPHNDIPVGLLHLIPLGLAKHVTSFILKKQPTPVVEKLKAFMQSLSSRKIYDNFFQFLDSRQGKDMKDYLQFAPLNMLFSGVQTKYVKMMCCLSRLQVALHRDAYSEVEIQEVQALVEEYHHRIDRDAPELQNKVKTHMLVHLVQDIRNHGPPKSYTEDAFEKNHGMIREQVFLQNQKARSRDLCASYAKQIVASHVTSGGYFPTESGWANASEEVQRLHKLPHVQKFMGLKDPDISSRMPGAVSKLERTRHCKPITKLVQTVELFNLDPNTWEGSSVTKGKAVTCRNGQLVNAGDWVELLDRNEENRFAIFEEGLIVTKPRGQKMLQAKLQSAQIVTDTVLKCCLYEVREVFHLDTRYIKSKANLTHDCLGGKCRVLSKNVKVLIEQETVTTVKKVVQHNLSHKLYILNTFHL